MDTFIVEQNETPKRRITKSYTVGIPKFINFDINVSVNRKSEKKSFLPRTNSTPSVLSHTKDDDIKEIVITPTSGSDDVMQTANHSDSTEMIVDNIVAPQKVVAFVRSPVTSPRRMENTRHSDRRGALGSNRNGTKTAPTSPRDSIKLSEEEIPKLSHPLPMMRSPRQSLYATNVVRRPRDTSMPNIGSAALACKLEKLVFNTTEIVATPIKREPVQRSDSQYGRDIDGFLKEMSLIEEEECVSFGDTYESVVFEEENRSRTDSLYKNEVRYGDILPAELVNHEAVHPYNNGVMNIRHKVYEIDHPITNFCFHCDRNLANSHFRRQVCLTEVKPDIIYGHVRCKIFRDINLCSECFHTSDLAYGVISITPRAKNFYQSMYPQ